MTKTILITGATDGIGLLTAKNLASEGHTILLHGRSTAKLEAAAKEVGGTTQSYSADLSRMADVTAMADAIRKDHRQLDVVINNAGVLKIKDTMTADGFDARFMVNTFAPYVLTRALLPIIPRDVLSQHVMFEHPTQRRKARLRKTSPFTFSHSKVT